MTTSNMVMRHYQSFILWSVVTLLTTTQPVQCDVSCVTGQFYVGGAGNVTCNFGENVRDTKHNFNIVLYTNPQDSGTYVLLCNWEKESLECNVKQNYRFDQATTPVTDSLVLEIPTVAESMAGLYVCQLVPDNGIPVHTCQLNVTDPPPTTPPPCTTSKPLIADQGTADQGQEAVIAGLIAVAVLLVICIGCFVLLWFKFDLVKRGESYNQQPDGWTEYIICCKLCNVLGIKRPLGVSDRDDPESNRNTEGKRQFQPNTDLKESAPLLGSGKTNHDDNVENDKTEHENYRGGTDGRSVGSGVGKGARSGVGDIDGNVGEGTATAEVAPVSTPESPHKPDAVKEENPTKPQMLKEDENELSGPPIPPGNDTNIVPAAANYASSNKAPGDPSRPGRPSKSGLYPTGSGNQTPGKYDLTPPSKSGTTSGQGIRKSASPSTDGKEEVDKSESQPSQLYKQSTSKPFSLAPAKKLGSVKHQDKLGSVEKEVSQQLPSNPSLEQPSSSDFPQSSHPDATNGLNTNSQVKQEPSSALPQSSEHVADDKERVMPPTTETQDSGDNRTNTEVTEQQDKERSEDEQHNGDNEDAPTASGETSPEPQEYVTTEKREDQQEEEKRGNEQVETAKPLDQGISNTDVQDPPAEDTQSDQSDSTLRNSDGSKAPADNSATGDKSVGQTSAEPAKEHHPVQAGNQDESEDTGASGNRDESQGANSHGQEQSDDSGTSNSPSKTNSSLLTSNLPAHPKDDAPPSTEVQDKEKAGDSDGSPGVHNVHVKPGEESPDKWIEDQPDSGESTLSANLEDDAPPLSLFSPEVQDTGEAGDSDGSPGIHNVHEKPIEESPDKRIKDQPDSGEAIAPAPPEDANEKENVQETTDKDLDEALTSPDNPHSGQSPGPEGANQHSADAVSVSSAEKKTRQQIFDKRLNPHRDRGDYRETKTFSLPRGAELSENPPLLHEEPLETPGEEALSQASTDIDELVTLFQGAPLTTKVENQDNNTEG